MIKVCFMGGISRYSNKSVNYMLAEIEDGLELYAEIELPNYDVPEEYGYDELKEEIINQAKENKIDVKKLEFWWD